MAKRNKKKPKLVQVNGRLWEDDLVEIKRIADEKRHPWWIELRSMVHEAVKEAIRRRRAPIVD